MIELTRRYRFAASHRLHSEALSAKDNADLYGKCNHPFGHGHDYILEVTIGGQVDPRTGVLLPVSKLDQLVQRHVLQLFSSRNINLDVPYFAGLPPTTENIASVIARILVEAWGKVGDQQIGNSVRIRRVHIRETARNSCEVLIGRSTGLQTERVFANGESEIV